MTDVIDRLAEALEADQPCGERSTIYAGLALQELLARDDLGWAYSTPHPYWHGTRERQPRQGVTARVRWLILERDRHRCRYCGATPEDALLVVDHVIPVAHGGTDEPDNLATACDLCNQGKSDSELGPVG